MQPNRLRLPFLSFALSSSILAQGLTPGTAVVATLGYNGNTQSIDQAGNGVFVVDPLARTSTPLTIAGFPATSAECPWTVVLESTQSLLLTTASIAVGGGPIPSGNLYRAAWNGSGFVATSLLNAPMNEGVIDCVTLGSTIWFTTCSLFNTGVPASGKLWSVPAAGGTPTLVADLAQQGMPGSAGALEPVGTVLHVFSFCSDSSNYLAGEHWTVDTATQPVTTARVGSLPLASRPGSTNNWIGALNCAWDPRQAAFVLSGVHGELLWRSPNGANLHRRSLPSTAWYWTDYLATGLAVDTDTGSVLWGDKESHVEILRLQAGPFQLERVLVAPIQPTFHRFVMGIAYVPGAAQYLQVGPTGCPRITEFMVNDANSRPFAGNPSFTMQLDSFAGSAWLAFGGGNTNWFGNPLPFLLPGAPGCTVGSSGDLATVFVPRGATGLSHTVAIPAAAIGLQLYTQWAVLQPNANALGVVLSDARQLLVR